MFERAVAHLFLIMKALLLLHISLSLLFQAVVKAIAVKQIPLVCKGIAYKV